MNCYQKFGNLWVFILFPFVYSHQSPVKIFNIGK